MPELTTTSLDAALAPIVTMLQADGYGLSVDIVPDALRVAVSAGPDACEECLVPKPVFEAVLRSTLEKAGIALGPTTIDLTYPAASEHA